MDPGLRRDDTGIWTRPATDRLVIALAQLNQLVGDLRGNADAMLVARAKAAGADLIVYPELQLIGYPTEDLVLKPALAERAKEELQRLAGANADGGPAMLVGNIHKGEDGLRSEEHTYELQTLMRTQYP